MAHTVTGKLNKSANQFQAGESVGFGIRIGVKYYDRSTKQDAWTNYSATVFAKNPNQIAFYQSALVEGSIVSVSGESLAVETYDGPNGQVITLSMNNSRIEFIHNPVQQPAPQQGGYQQPAPQQAPRAQAPHGHPDNNRSQPPQQPPQPNGFTDFNEDIPF